MQGTRRTPVTRVDGRSNRPGRAAWPALSLAAGVTAGGCAGGDAGATALWAGGLGLAVGLALSLWPVLRRRAAEVAVWRDAARIAELTRAASMAELSAWGDDEFGKPIASLLNNVGAARRLLERGGPALPEATAAVDEARLAGEEVAHAIRRLRLFTGSSSGRREPIQLDEVVREVVQLIRRHARVHGVSLRAAPQAGLPPVRGDPDRLFQLVLSLVIAAVEAASDSPGGVVEVRVAAADGWVELAVRDSGKPLSEADRPQLFAPFSPLRRGGLGIGLYMARVIAESHGGQITAERPAAGALFRVVLPAAAGARAGQAVASGAAAGT